MILYFKFHSFPTPAYIFAYLETPPISKQSCRKDMVSARESNNLKFVMYGHKLIQEIVSINKSFKS